MRALVDRVRDYLGQSSDVTQQELEKRLQERRSVPVQASIELASPRLKEMLDRQFDAFQSLDTKAQLLITGELGLGLVGQTVLGVPGRVVPAVFFVVSLGLASLSLAIALSVLSPRMMRNGPGPIELAEATSYQKIQLSQSIVDSDAVAAQLNQAVLERKSRRLNMSILLVTIAVAGFLVAGVLGGLDSKQAGEPSGSPASTVSAHATVTTSQADR
jgi:hypothetical protein